MPRQTKKNHIVRLIHARGKSILQVAQEMGYNYATLYRKVHGHRRWKASELDRLAQILDVPVFALRTESDPGYVAQKLRELGLDPNEYLTPEILSV